MNLVGLNAARCAEGRHAWVPMDVLRRPGQHQERCRGCGAHGVWMSAADAVSGTERQASHATSSLLATSGTLATGRLGS